MDPHCDPKLEDSKPIFLHDTLAHDVASPYQVWLQKVSSWADMSTWTFTGILNLFCDLALDHSRAIQSFHKTIHLMTMCIHTKFSCKRKSSSDNISKRHTLIMLFITVTLTLKTTIKFLHQTLWLMMMYYQTKFGSKGSAVQKIQ